MRVIAWRLAAASVLGAMLLAGCSAWPFGDGAVTQPLPAASDYLTANPATVTLHATQVGCCYTEGALHFVQLEGPTSRSWQVDDGSGGIPTGDTFVLGSKTVTVQPGSYAVTLFARPCTSSCDYLAPEVARCTASFAALPDEQVDVAVSFPMEKPCTIQVTRAAAPTP